MTNVSHRTLSFSSSLVTCGNRLEILGSLSARKAHTLPSLTKDRSATAICQVHLIADHSHTHAVRTYPQGLIARRRYCVYEVIIDNQEGEKSPADD